MNTPPPFKLLQQLAEYPDVAQGIARGEIQSARQHFLEYGYEEGRLSAPD